MKNKTESRDADWKEYRHKTPWKIPNTSRFPV